MLSTYADLVLMMRTLDLVSIITTLEVKQFLKLAQAVKDKQGG